jgi:hypothetical protein
MNEVYLRLTDVVRQETVEVRFDRRLSFRENFSLLKQMIKRDYEEAEVYDPDKKIFLDRNIPLSEFEFAGFVRLHLFYSA